MIALTLLEQLNKSLKWIEFKKWYKEQLYQVPFGDGDLYRVGFIELPFEFQKGVFEKFIEDNSHIQRKTDATEWYLWTEKTGNKYFETFEELLLYYFNEVQVYWEWYWGTDLNDLNEHSEKIKFTDFDKMKDFSAKHAYSCKHLKPNYWACYDVVQI